MAGIGLVAVACAGGPSPQPDSTPGTVPSVAAPPASVAPAQMFAPNATLALGLRGEPTNWNPVVTGGGADEALAVIADAVLPTASGGSLVTAATETSTRPQTVVYEIDPRATWSDGVAITGADFIYTWQSQSGEDRFRDRGGLDFTPESTTGYRQIASVTSPAGNPNRVVVRFTTPDPVTTPVSGGPFLVQSYQPGADVVLVRNPRWWGPSARLETIDIVFVASASEAVESLQQGELDAAFLLFPPAAVAELRATPGLVVAAGPRSEVLAYQGRYAHLGLDGARSGLNSTVAEWGLPQSA